MSTDPRPVLIKYRVDKITLDVFRLEEEVPGEISHLLAWGVDGPETIQGGHRVFDSVGEAQGYVLEEAMARAQYWLKVAENVEC